MSANRNSQGYDPFEPGRSTPEFEQFARENYASRARSTVHAQAGSKKNRGQQAHGGGMPSRAARYNNGAPDGWQYSVESRMPSHGGYRSKLGYRRGGIVPALLVVALALCIEVFGFNLAFFTSYPNETPGSYMVNGQEHMAVGSLTLDASNNEFEITGLDDTIRNIHFQLSIAPSSEGEAVDNTVQVVMYLRDEGNANYYSLPTVSVDPDDGASTYIDLEPAGHCHAIRVTFTNLDSVGTATVQDIGLNVQVPFELNPVRLAGIAIILALLFALRPQSGLYATLLDLCRNRQKAFVVGLVMLEVAAVFLLVLSNDHYIGMVHSSATENYYQYQKLAEAFLQGHLYLDDAPSDALLSMDNPYDTNARASQGVPYLWDHAYFEGKYYVYFGVLPCLVFFLPYYLLTGAHFATWLAVAICDTAYVVGLACLLRMICIRWFPRTSLGVFVVLDVMLCIAGGGLIVARTPSMYFLPETMGLACVAWGLFFWIRGTSYNVIARRYVVVGSLLFACTLACRPQMVLGAVFGLLLFWPFWRDSRENRLARRRAKGDLMVAFVPFVVIGIAVCAYNAARFGSPLDFGANYNLTTNDMTHRGFHVERIPFGLFAYLIQPPNLGSQFPFLQQAYMDPAYQGITIYEPMFGGYFFLYPMTLVLLALPLAKRGLQDKGLMTPVVTALCVALVLCVFDLQGAGILMRYICDFGVYIALSAAAVYLELLQVRSETPLTEGWTTVVKGGHRTAFSVGSSDVQTVSVYRMMLYFLYATLVLMAVVAVLLWDAFGMY